MEPAVASALADSLDLVNRALEASQSLEADNTALRVKVAEQNQVISEKVAAATKPVFDSKRLTSALTKLADQSFIDPANIEKIANQIIADPNQAIDLAVRLAACSAGAHQEGHAVSKSAGHQVPTSDPDGWNAVIRKRAV